MRAASADRGRVLEAAFHYPPYELPIDMWRDLPPPTAPRDGSRAPSTRTAACGSFTRRTSPRTRSVATARTSPTCSCFPSADPATVLRSWGADGWVTELPARAPKVLPATRSSRSATLVSDAAAHRVPRRRPGRPDRPQRHRLPARLRGASASSAAKCSPASSQAHPDRRRGERRSAAGCTSTPSRGSSRFSCTARCGCCRRT